MTVQYNIHFHNSIVLQTELEKLAAVFIELVAENIKQSHFHDKNH